MEIWKQTVQAAEHSGREGPARQKHPRIALKCVGTAALIALHGAALADSLTISGLVTAGPTYTSNAGGGSRFGLDSGPHRPNYLAFNGTESLGGGASAYFRLAGRFYSDIGASVGGILFNTYSVVGLRGNLGDVQLGYTRDFMFDYFTVGGYSGSYYGGLWGASQGPFTNFGGVYGAARGGSFDYDRANGESLANAVKYTHQFGPLKVGAMYGFGERPGSVRNGGTYSLGALYESGRFGATVAFTDFKDASTADSNAHIRALGTGAKWATDSWQVSTSYSRTENANTEGVIDTYGVGGTKSFNQHYGLTLHYQYMKGNTPLLNRHAHQVLLEAETWLSKRSRIYLQTTYQLAGGSNARAWINGAPAASGGSRQLLGGVFIEHAF